VKARELDVVERIFDEMIGRNLAGESTARRVLHLVVRTDTELLGVELTRTMTLTAAVGDIGLAPLLRVRTAHKRLGDFAVELRP
jgi:hypothetical protein